MAAGSRDRPSMRAPGRYPQWRSRFLRYVDTRPNVAEHTTLETPANMSPENKAHFLAEQEAIHLILTRIGNDIYSTVDACQTAQEMREAIERSHTSTRHKGKEIAKPITLPSETASEKDNDPEQAQRDKDMQKNLALIAKYFKKIYKPTNNNLRTSSNSKNKNVDMTPRYMAKIHEVPNADSGTDSEPVEQKANTTLAEELTECKAVLTKASKSLGESISVRDSCLVAFQTK
nr:hypothetical protein [Tanacetum cinerariifolium]